MRGQSIAAAGALAIIGALTASPYVGAQEPNGPVIGFLNSASPGPFAHLVDAYRGGLGELGFTEGKNVRIEYRWAETQADRLPGLAKELVDQKVSVITAAGGTVSAKAAKAATSTIPVVFVIGDDPIQFGLVNSLSHPGGNVTGVTVIASQLEAKRLELLQQVAPGDKTVAMLVNSANPNAAGQIKEAQDAITALGGQLVVVEVPGDSDLKAAFATMVEKHAQALLVNADPVFNSRRNEIAALATQNSLPGIFEWREFVSAGGLMSYGTSIADAYRQAGVYTARILKGANAAELPVAEPTKFELVINLKTAETFGLTVPAELLARADAVIK
jgi:putative tryptophan/tyrosine transport system substrate-binding protein